MQISHKILVLITILFTYQNRLRKKKLCVIKCSISGFFRECTKVKTLIFDNRLFISVIKHYSIVICNYSGIILKTEFCYCSYAADVI